MKEKLRCCSHYLRKAVEYMTANPGTPQEKLGGMIANTGFGGIAENDFPFGPLKDDFEAISGQMNKDTDPQFNIATMCDERARTVIKQIRKLSDDVTRALEWAEVEANPSFPLRF